jgi:hypothetical protein
LKISAAAFGKSDRVPSTSTDKQVATMEEHRC